MSASTNSYRTTTNDNPVHDDSRIYFGNVNPDSEETKNRASSAEALGFTAYNMNDYQRQFLASPAVAEAIRLFNSSPNPDIWLNRLRSIVEAIITPNDTFFTNIAESFTGDLNGTAVLTTAYNNLNALVAEFHQWFNSLPVEQRQQFSDAGINIALDGGSAITGSSSPSPSVQSSEVVEASNKSFDNAVNFVTSTAGGLLNLIGLVNNVFSLRQQKRSIDVSENSTLSSVNLQRLALGLSPLSSLKDVNSSKVQEADVLSAFGIKSSNEAEAGSKKSRISLETDVNPLYDAVDDATRLRIGPYNEIMAELGNIQLGQRIYQMLYDKEKLAFDSKQLEINSQIQSEYGSALAAGEAQTALAEQAAKQVDFRTSSKLKEFGEQLYEYKKAMLSDWIDKANSDSPDAFIYSSMLMKSGLEMTEFMGPADAWLNYTERGSGILDDILGIFTPAKWLRPKKVFNKSSTYSKSIINK